jgi:hypothetical protein
MWQDFHRGWLYQIQRLAKWQKYRKNLDPGTMVLMFHEDKLKSTRNQWDVGRIVEITKGADGQARRALIAVERPQNSLDQYNTVTHWRSVNKLVPIDIVADQVTRILPFDLTKYPRRVSPDKDEPRQEQYAEISVSEDDLNSDKDGINKINDIGLTKVKELASRE